MFSASASKQTQFIIKSEQQQKINVYPQEIKAVNMTGIWYPKNHAFS